MARARGSGHGTIPSMAEPWEGMTDADAARYTSDVLADLDSRIRVVAAARSEAVRSMRDGGMSVRQICDELGLSRWVVCAILRPAQRSDGGTPPNTP